MKKTGHYRRLVREVLACLTCLTVVLVFCLIGMDDVTLSIALAPVALVTLAILPRFSQIEKHLTKTARQGVGNG